METSDRAPDGIEPLVGFRMWFYRLDGIRAHLHPLCSPGDLTTPSPWDGAESGWVVASCPSDHVDPGHVPAWDSTCGFYATKRVSTLIQQPVLDLDDAGSGRILGRVELAGKIIEHDHGYRARRARIAELIPVEGDEPNSMRLAALLGLPLGDPIVLVRLSPRTSPWWRPPDGPSTPRLRVKDWVQHVAA